MGKYFGKKCFLSFLNHVGESLCSNIRGKHFFGAFLRGCTFLFWSSSMTVTFCGHSQYTSSKEDEQKIISFLTEIIGDCHAELYLGGYGSFDKFARECGKKYQGTHPNTKLIFVTPYITIDHQKDHLDNNKDLYDEILYPSLENKPLKYAISYRNKWMVEQADYVIAYITHAWGEAYQTYKHAQRKKKPLFNISGKEI